MDPESAGNLLVFSHKKKQRDAQKSANQVDTVTDNSFVLYYVNRQPMSIGIGPDIQIMTVF